MKQSQEQSLVRLTVCPVPPDAGSKEAMPQNQPLRISRPKTQTPSHCGPKPLQRFSVKSSASATVRCAKVQRVPSLAPAAVHQVHSPVMAEVPCHRTHLSSVSLSPPKAATLPPLPAFAPKVPSLRFCRKNALV